MRKTWSAVFLTAKKISAHHKISHKNGDGFDIVANIVRFDMDRHRRDSSHGRVAPRILQIVLLAIFALMSVRISLIGWSRRMVESQKSVVGAPWHEESEIVMPWHTEPRVQRVSTHVQPRLQYGPTKRNASDRPHIFGYHSDDEDEKERHHRVPHKRGHGSHDESRGSSVRYRHRPKRRQHRSSADFIENPCKIINHVSEKPPLLNDSVSRIRSTKQTSRLSTVSRQAQSSSAMGCLVDKLAEGKDSADYGGYSTQQFPHLRSVVAIN